MKRILFVLLAIVLGISSASFGQISQGGTPKSFGLDEKIGLNEVPFETMPQVDVEALRAEDLVIDPLKDRPWRFGQNFEVSLNPDNSGVWDNFENGDRIWRLGITCPEALSINLTFDRYRLAKGAELFIYTRDKKEIIGAFTDFNNQDHGYLATILLPGQSIVIEYFEPSTAEFPGEINLWRVTHGYRGVHDFAKGFGGSGSCNVNVACEFGDDWQEQIRSVAMLVSGGNGFCSGALINNTSNDGTPYFLSANHCYTTPSSVVYWFNWQSSTCTNPASSPSYNSISGATQKARNATSDFWLVQLSSTPPENYNIYYSGWNRTADASITGQIVGIHHPSGDIKKISWANGGVTTSNYLGATGTGTSHWRVGSWSDGTTTEGGSSGSPLFDPQGRIIGQLHGGYAACGNTQPDWYGTMNISWNGGGSDATRLSTWLDPTNTGVTEMNGFDPYGGTVNVPFFEESFEGETFPPANWTLESAVASNTWQVTTGYSISGTPPTPIDPQEGSKFAYVQWQTGQDQDEWLITPSVNLSGVTDLKLSFYFNGSYHWSVTPNDNCNLKVNAKIGNGDWTEIWNEEEIGEWSTYAWTNVLLTELDAYEGESDVKFAFVYTGDDGANFNIDNIVLSKSGQPTYSLTISVEGEGTTDPEVGEHFYEPEESVELTATPSDGWEFEMWVVNGNIVTQNPTTTIMESNVTAVAHFINNSPQHTLTIGVNGNGTTNPEAGEHLYYEGENVELTATPDNNWFFVKWVIGGNDITENPTTVTVNSDISAVAYFTDDSGVDPNVFASIQLYPNPFTSTITLKNAEGINRVVISNTLGQIIKEVALFGNPIETISTEGLAKGTYLITLFGKDGEKQVRSIIRE